MSLDDWHLIFVSACLILALTSLAPLVMAYLPGREEPFFALAVLGEEGMAELYYPGDAPNIEVGEEAHWILYLYNHMGEAQYVAVRAKLLNSTVLAPNSTTLFQSPSPTIYETRRIIRDNETWLHPFDWSLLNVSRDGDSTIIEGLMINGEPFKTNVIGKNVYNFRLVFELWTYDEKSQDLIFGWVSNESYRCAWNQIWFNVTYAHERST